MFSGRFTETVIMVLMSSWLISKSGPIRAVKAFTSTQNVNRGFAAAVGKQRFARSEMRQIKLRTHVEEDLDQALSSFLADSKPKSATKKIKALSEFADVMPKRESAVKLEPVSLSDLVEKTEVRTGLD
jgi:hypothetical protein